MTFLNRLQSRKDVDNADIPEIIERAERLRQRHIATLEREHKRSTVQEVNRVGMELSIPDSFIEDAIVELHKERQAVKVTAQKYNEQQEANTRIRLWTTGVIRIVVIMVGMIVLLRGGEWLWFVLDFIPVKTEPTETEIIVQERIVRETVVRTVEENVVSNSGPNSTSEVLYRPKSEGSNPVPPVPQSLKTLEVTTPNISTSLPEMAKSIEGEWVLDAYLIYENGVESPMEVPIVYEPLELPKSWRFTNGKYKRVMDVDLVFTAHFEMMTLPESIQPNLDEQGEWAQIVASNVVSNIPGVRRQNDYFAVLLSQDSMTIWYLGPNSYRKKVPSQAERYLRK